MESLVVSVQGLEGVTTVMVSVRVMFWQERRHGAVALPMADRRRYRPEMAARRVMACGLGL
jgi:hypothetical protein